MLVSSDYKTVDGLIRNGCDRESAEKIAMLVRKIDECFGEHNRQYEQKYGEQDD